MIRVEHLYKVYGQLPALADVSFEVGPGEVFGLLGRNGSGKTTLLRILTGFRLPTSGSIRVAGLDVVANSVGVRRRIGYAAEHAHLYPELTVRGLLRFVATVRGVARRERDSRIDEVIERFRLAAVAQRPVAHCSKGYRERLSLAQAVLHRPAVLFLDEPTAGLDPEQRLITWGLIRELARDSTVVMSSHDLHEVGVLCQRVLVLDRGRVARLGGLEELGGEAGIAAIFRTTRERDGRRAA